MEETLSKEKVKIGFNRILFEKRLDLKLTRKQAAKVLGFSWFHLVVLERGYIKLSLKDKEAFIKGYHVDESFFIDTYEYPDVINEKIYSPLKINKLFEKASKSKSFRIVNAILTFLFIGMLIGGLCSDPRITKSTANFFSESSKSYQSFVVDNGHEGSKSDTYSEFSLLVLDKSYYVESNPISVVSYQRQRFYVFEKERNLQFFFLNACFDTNYDGTDYRMVYEQRLIGDGKLRIHYYILKEAPEEKWAPICRIVVDNQKDILFQNNFKFVSVYDINFDGSGAKILHEGDEKFAWYKVAFSNYYDVFENDLDYLFTKELTGQNKTYQQFFESYNPDVTSYYSRLNFSRILGICGLILAIITLGLLVFSFVEKFHLGRRALKYIEDEKEEKNLLSETVRQEEGKKELPRNKWINCVIPEFLMRTIILVLLFISSIATFLIFLNILKIDATGISFSLGMKEVLGNLSVVAVMIVYFVKLDIYQNKKDYIGFSTFLFFGGLLYYLVLVFIYYALEGLGSSVQSVSHTIFDYLPGNVIWGILVFNMCTLLLFAPIKKNKESRNKVLLVRFSSILPFSYLIASSVITIGMKVWNWDIPYAVSSLFFFKAPMITVFAIVYILGVYIYRYVAKKKYGVINGRIYITGNKYNYIRNSMAALTVFVIGIFDLLCLFFWKDNVLGFGTNYLMLIAVPFMVFYHPHLGKRNPTWDFIYNILYGFVYIVGIVLIVIAVLKIMSTI